MDITIEDVLNVGDEVEEQMKAVQKRYEGRLDVNKHRACSACGTDLIRIPSRNQIRGVNLARFSCPKCHEEVDVLPI